MPNSYKIAVVPGDGTGLEVVKQGLKVLDTVVHKCGFRLKFTHYDLGGEHYMATGEILSETFLSQLEGFDLLNCI